MYIFWSKTARSFYLYCNETIAQLSREGAMELLKRGYATLKY